MLVPLGDWHVPEQTTGNATRTRLTKTDACISVDTEHTAERFCMGHTAFNSSSLPTPDGQTYESEREGGNITKKNRHECRTRVVQSHTDLEPLTLPFPPAPRAAVTSLHTPQENQSVRSYCTRKRHVSVGARAT